MATSDDPAPTSAALEDISGPGGPRKSFKRLNSKTEPLFWIVFARAWPRLAEFGFGLDRAWPNFNIHNMERVHADSRREPDS